MPELTAEELAKAETMTAEELKAAALKESQQDEIEVPPEERAEEPEPETQADEPEPAEQVFRKVIQNDDGSTDVYEASSLEELVDKIAEGKRAAVAQMKRVQASERELAAKVKQQAEDDAYVTGEQFKADPVKAAREIARKEFNDLKASEQRSMEAQSRFVNTHPDYVADPKNGNGARMMAEYRRLFPDATEFTSEGLEKAYLSLKRDELLVLRSEEADAATEVEAEATARTERPKVEATQPRSPKRSSTISTRTSARGVAPVKQGFDEDEAYNLPLDELRKRAEKAMAEAARE